MTVTFLMLIVFGLILFVIMGNNIEPKPQIESKPALREGAFYDYANKYVTQIAPPWLVKELKPYANKVVKRMLDLSKMYKAEGIQFKLADEMELIECSLELCLKKISSFGKTELPTLTPSSVSPRPPSPITPQRTPRVNADAS